MKTWNENLEQYEDDDEYLTEQAVENEPSLGRGVLPHMRSEAKVRRTKKKSGASTDHIRELIRNASG